MPSCCKGSFMKSSLTVQSISMPHMLLEKGSGGIGGYHAQSATSPGIGRCHRLIRYTQFSCLLSAIMSSDWQSQVLIWSVGPRFGQSGALTSYGCSG